MLPDASLMPPFKVRTVVAAGEKVAPPVFSVTVRPVTVGVTEGGQTEIKSGIQAGDVLVTNGVDRLQEKSKVNPRIAGEAPKDDQGGGGAKSGRKGGRGKQQ